MGYDLCPRNKQTKGWYANLSFMDNIRQAMEKARIDKGITAKLCFCDGEYVKKAEALEIAEKLSAFLEKNPVILLGTGKTLKKYEAEMKKFSESNELLGWNGKKHEGITILRKGDDLWKSMQGFADFCRKSGGFWVW